MKAHSIEPHEIAQAAIAKALLETHTALPGKVISVTITATQRLATVQPLAQRKIRGVETLQTLPPITNAPIHYPGGGGFEIVWPLLPNDDCLILFAERAIDGWLDKGGLYDPSDPRRHSLNDAIVIPTVHPTKGTATYDGVSLIFGGAAFKLGELATLAAARVSDPVSVSAALMTWITAVTAATMVPPLVGSTIGSIASGSSKVKIE